MTDGYNETEAVTSSGWGSCAGDILSTVFSYLDISHLIRMEMINEHWACVARDDHLWKRRFLIDFSITVRAELYLSDSWHDEYRILRGLTPRVQVACLREHADAVLHVAFSPDGAMFATCSKDASVKLLASRDLSLPFHWRATIFAQFNESSNAVLVAGVKNQPDLQHAAGEIVVYEIDQEEGAMHFRCRVVNRPFDICGCWFDEIHLLNGELHPFASSLLHASSISQIWLCKASQDLHNERAAVLAPFFRFLNRDGAVVRNMMIGNVVSARFRAVVRLTEMAKRENKSLEAKTAELLDDDGEDVARDQLEQRLLNTTVACINCTLRHHLTQEEYGASLQGACRCVCHSSLQDRLLIFSTGFGCAVPHQIAFKLISSKEMLERLNGEVMTAERREAVLRRLRQVRASQSRTSSPSSSSDVEHVDDDASSSSSSDDGFDHVPDAVQQMNALLEQFDQPDHVIDMDGHIIGMALSPDHRHLYVNVRRFLTAIDANRPSVSPRISEQIELREIDLNAMVLRDAVYEGHKAYSSKSACFKIAPAVGEHLLLSGAEDNAAYVWSRQHGCLVAQLPHEAVVSAIALNPADSSMAVTVSDDKTIRIWRSPRAIGRYGQRED